MCGDSASVAAFVLAGGKSSRMGTDKAFVTLGGRILIDHMLALATSITSNVRIVGDPDKYSSFAPVIPDVYRDCGPLGGIHAALRASGSELNLMLAVDVPMVPPEFLKFLIRRAQQFPAAVTVPRAEGRLQPLCAVYRRPFANMAETALREGRYKIGTLFSGDVANVVEEEEWRAAGFSAAVFRNLNTVEDLAGL
jgi:molybdopterin-guanine dinucleotide biosynthesis protein A